MDHNFQKKPAMGGTELATIELFQHLPEHYQKKFQFVISRMCGTKLKDKPRILWIHDLPHDAAYIKLDFFLFTKLIFVSHWQQEKFAAYHKLPYSQGIVIPNAILPIPIHKKKKTEKLQLIYCSTPHRGLNILLDAIDLLERTDYHLHVYSSFTLYGIDLDTNFQKLFDRCHAHPNITYYGAVDYKTLRKAWESMHILAYPSTWEETSCRVAMEAMSAGCALVTSSLGALPETTTEFSYSYSYTELPREHVRRFAAKLNSTLNSYWSKETQSNLKQQTKYAHTHFSWSHRIQEWISILDSIRT